MHPVRIDSPLLNLKRKPDREHWRFNPLPADSQTRWEAQREKDSYQKDKNWKWNKYFQNRTSRAEFSSLCMELTLSVPVVLLNSHNLSSYFSLNKFERILLLIFSSLLCLISSHFLMTKCFNLYVLCKEKLGDDKRLGLKGLNSIN